MNMINQLTQIRDILGHDIEMHEQRVLDKWLLDVDQGMCTMEDIICAMHAIKQYAPEGAVFEYYDKPLEDMRRKGRL